jgi:hypothetical protein
MTETRPVVHVLTDGSGSDGLSRLDSTTAVLSQVGAAPGSIYGPLSDREIYARMLRGDHATFIGLAEELAAALVREGTTLVVGDAIEGFNPSHDVCRYVINAAVRLASTPQRRIATCAFALDGAPDVTPDPAAGEARRFRLDDATLDRKLHAAHTYAELRAEVDHALERFGKEPFRSECLWPVDLADPYGWDTTAVPFYEVHGARRVAKGTYDRVLTFRDHVQPLADALWSHCAITA